MNHLTRIPTNLNMNARDDEDIEVTDEPARTNDAARQRGAGPSKRAEMEERIEEAREVVKDHGDDDRQPNVARDKVEEELRQEESLTNKSLDDADAVEQAVQLRVEARLAEEQVVRQVNQAVDQLNEIRQAANQIETDEPGSISHQQAQAAVEQAEAPMAALISMLNGEGDI